MSHRASEASISSHSSFPNCSFLLTAQGLVQLTQTILGGVCTGLAGYYGHEYYNDLDAQAAESIALFFELNPSDIWMWLQLTFFLVVAATFLVNTLCMLLSNVLSFTSASMLNRTLYNVLYNLLAFMLYLPASVVLILAIEKDYLKGHRDGLYYKSLLAASICGVLNSVLYLVSGVLSYRSFRGVVT